MLAYHQDIQTIKHHTTDPIRQVPNEVSSFIFELSIPDILSICERRFPEKHERSGPLKLGAVCKLWRKIAWETPRLWTSVYINVLATSSRSAYGDQMPKINSSKLATFHEWLSRAGSRLPLSIYMNLGPIRNGFYGEARSHALQKNYGPFVGLINTYSSRLHNLSLTCAPTLISNLTGNSEGMPMVRRLELLATQEMYVNSNDHTVEFNFSLVAGMPWPSSVSVSHHPLKSINIYWNNVTKLDVSCSNASECLEVLQRATKLVQCCFVFINVETTDSQTHVHGTLTYVVHHTLDKLDIREVYSSNTNTRIENLLDALILPALRTMKIDREDQTLPCDALLSLIYRSSCSLEKLWVHLVVFTEDKLVLLLQSLSPSLKTLVLLPSSTMNHQPRNIFSLLAGSSNLAEDSNPQDLFLPKLEYLQFLISKSTKIPWDLVPNIFGPIHDIREHRRPLRYLSIINHMELQGLHTVTLLDKDIILDKAIVERLLDIVDAGLTLQLPWDVTREDLCNLLDKYKSDSDSF